MTIIQPETVLSQGRTSIYILTTPPADPAAPTLTELNAGVVASCYFYGGTFPSTGEQNKGERPRKVCHKVVPEALGSVRFTIETVQYSHDPQADDAAPANAVRTALAEDAEVWIYDRMGKDAETAALAADDVLRGHNVDAGVQNWGQTGDGEFDEFSITQSLSYTGDQPRPVMAVATGP